MVEFSEFMLRTLFAGACALLFGLDREAKSQRLCAHTYILMALGSAVLMSVAISFSVSAVAKD
ncbi:MgtC/SapB family protein [Paracoccus sediminilitoris]|uniref:hypothetical protein n=1 Tax=Paracoccus sediminilitoris TaxID=2202419 RepID=UPI000DB9CA98|nr:hypothetical protein [Paracoccus sediminilitoris]